MATDQFKLEYEDFSPKLERLEKALIEQLKEIVASNNIALGFPIQSRVKRFDSISNKLENRRFHIKKSVKELQDLVGLRIILLFKKDVHKISQLLRDNLNVLKNYNTSDKLQDDQFGYSSEHLIVKIPEEWLSVPTFKGLEEATAEIQIRTLSQHTWAEASQILQYKEENSVPKEIKRSTGRIAALLEMVDLEFDRLLTQRESYKTALSISTNENEILNVDLLENILDQKLPPNNKELNEELYSEVLNELLEFNIRTKKDLESLIDENIVYIMSEDQNRVKEILNNSHDYPSDDIYRAKSGVFYTHVGLTRILLGHLFGDDFYKIRVSSVKDEN